jgi:hypothetical protein
MQTWRTAFIPAMLVCAVTVAPALAQSRLPPGRGVGVPVPIAGAGLPFVAAGVVYLVRRRKRKG